MLATLLAIGAGPVAVTARAQARELGAGEAAVGAEARVVWGGRGEAKAQVPAALPWRLSCFCCCFFSGFIF